MPQLRLRGATQLSRTVKCKKMIKRARIIMIAVFVAVPYPISANAQKLGFVRNYGALAH
jgi:hypothetical protein